MYCFLLKTRKTTKKLLKNGKIHKKYNFNKIEFNYFMITESM